MKMLRPAALATAAAAMLWLAGCATPGDTKPTVQPVVPAQVGLETGAALPAVDAAWWQAFGDAKLNDLVARALQSQPALQTAAARLAKASALVDSTDARNGPQVGLGLDVTRQRYSENGIFPPPLGGSTRTSATLQANLSWELDFFGRHEAALKSALGGQKAAAADAEAARSLLAANIVHGYVALARLGAQREVAQRTLAQREETLALTRQRVQAGIETQVELKQSEGALPDVRQQIEALDEQIALVRHQLAALSAQPPTALDGLAPSMPALRAATLPDRIGADLLGRRADIVAARWRVEASTQDIAQARADFYPDINLVGFAGLSALGLGNLFEFGSRNMGVGPAIRLPIFDGGALRANLRGRNADFDAAVASYNAAVLDAVHQVADATTSVQSLARQQAQQVEAAQAAETAYDFAVQRYRAGLGTYLNVLSAESAVLAQRRLGVDLKARTLDAEASLMHALGGGYESRETLPALAAAR